jgi:ankyrin repeat protein
MNIRHAFFSRLYSSIFPRQRAMIDAVLDGDLGKTKVLLKHNPDLVHSKNNYGATPLHWAAAKGHKDVAELLVANKAEVDAKNVYGQTPVDLAAMNGYQDVAELLRQYVGQE